MCFFVFYHTTFCVFKNNTKKRRIERILVLTSDLCPFLARRRRFRIISCFVLIFCNRKTYMKIDNMLHFTTLVSIPWYVIETEEEDERIQIQRHFVCKRLINVGRYNVFKKLFKCETLITFR